MLERILILSALAASGSPAWAQQQAGQDCATQIASLQQSLSTPPLSASLGAPQAEKARILLQSAQILNEAGKTDICLQTVGEARSTMAEARAAAGGSAQAPPGQGRDTAAEAGAPPSRLTDAAAIQGSEVVNPQGEDLGNINRIVLDIPRGRIAYAVIGVGGFLGVGEKTVAVPWSALHPGDKDKTYILDADRHRLENAPTVESKDLQAMADSRVGEAVYAYFGQQPYWQQEQTAAAPSGLDEAALQQQMSRVDQSLRQLQQQTEQLLQQTQQSSAAEAHPPEARPPEMQIPGTPSHAPAAPEPARPPGAGASPPQAPAPPER